MRTYTSPVDDGVAVVIPKELASVGEPSGPVEIERVGDTLVIRPLVRRKLTGLAAKFAAFPAGFMAQGASSTRSGNAIGVMHLKRTEPAGLEMRPDLRDEGERALSALLEDLPVLPFDAAAAVDIAHQDVLLHPIPPHCSPPAPLR